MGRTGTRMAIHPTLLSFDLSPMALLQLATKSRADLKENIINFYKCVSPLSVLCFQLYHWNDNLWAWSASIFCVIQRWQLWCVLFTSHIVSSWAWEQRLSSSLSLLQPQGRNGPCPQDLWDKASSWQSKQEERRRERNVSSNGKLCLWSAENRQSSDLPLETASRECCLMMLLFPAILLPAH